MSVVTLVERGVMNSFAGAICYSVGVPKDDFRSPCAVMAWAKRTGRGRYLNGARMVAWRSVSSGKRLVVAKHRGAFFNRVVEQECARMRLEKPSVRARGCVDLLAMQKMYSYRDLGYAGF